MSLLSPIRTHIMPERTPEEPDRVVVQDIQLPDMERRDDIRVLPFDAGIGRIAAHAVTSTGADIFRGVFGETDKISAQQHASILAAKLISLGSETVHSLEPKLDEVTVDSSEIAKVILGNWVELRQTTTPETPTGDSHNGLKPVREQVLILPTGVKSGSELVNAQIEELWQNRAIQGDEAMVTLLAMRDLALTQHDTLDGSLAANALGHIKPDDTRIALK